ncbi:N-acyl-D-amino-acid deacylase family protein [Hyalangium gracile]|uniref:N-acyl-D-amino-acid deacylase family protein n=1 Tax=Hyalangium gracile TaxID=394092 RepID=UPI001CCE634F|nr:amidohydrolase family protein [Hyalangium gracile]
MLDLLLEGGTVVDGSGAAPRTADVGIRDGRIVEVGRITEPARERLHVPGAWVTPGFVDIHTHYDGQATWDETFSPSIHHGVTTLMMGNCGVGFAPVRPNGQERLIRLMEGVEDIPGTALAEGIRWGWEGFPRYMDALAAMPHSLDFLVQVPHDPLRIYVMGERAEANQAATPEDIAEMRQLLREALQAGAAGFTTGRTDNHRTAEGRETPASEASAAELEGLARAFQGLQHGVVQVVSDFDLLRDAGRFHAEFDLVEQLARAAGRPLSMTWLQRDPGGEQYEAIQARVEAAVTRGLPLYLQTAARGVGVLLGLDASFHPFIGFPGYKELAGLPRAERAAALRDPSRRARILSEKPERLAGDGTPIPPLVDILLQRIELISARMFPLGARPNYEPTLADSFLVRAKRSGQPVLATLYDYLCEGDGSSLIYFPIFNYNGGSLDVVRRMLEHPRALAGLSDAGAHVGTVCDASFSTFMLTWWSRDRERERLPVERLVEMLSARNARYLGLTDRGVIAPGMRADLNVMDPSRLGLRSPELRYDLPAGGKRFVQTAEGYLATFVAGRAVQRDGVITDERPGRLVRLGSRAG